MANRRIFGFRIRLVVGSACLGAILFGGVTLAVDYGDYFFGPKSGHGSWGTVFVILLALPAQVILEATGATTNPTFIYLYNAIGGYAIAAIVNAFFGAISFGTFASLTLLSPQEPTD
jgi:hypothetical protein